ncbi:MAG TPA: glucosamine-6-phosphate deaminase [Chloroflexota bacterium]|nr:glucosamine-6-phosphate deaminase [Chloroflexota bacterium]
MRIEIVADYQAVSRAAATHIAAVVAAKPTASIVLATGATPMGTYEELVARHERGDFDATRLRVFQLDAYLGLGRADRRSLYRWLAESFLTPLAVPDEHVVAFPGDTADPEATCLAFDAAVRDAGGFDLSVLGLGPNGHLGFNEPPAAPDSPTRVVDLSQESLGSNAAYWGGIDQVPRRALTAGLASLLAARDTLLLVSGAHKHRILRRTVEEGPTPDVPASYLQLAASVTVIADRAAWDGDGAQLEEGSGDG